MYSKWSISASSLYKILVNSSNIWFHLWWVVLIAQKPYRISPLEQRKKLPACKMKSVVHCHWYCSLAWSLFLAATLCSAPVLSSSTCPKCQEFEVLATKETFLRLERTTGRYLSSAFQRLLPSGLAEIGKSVQQNPHVVRSLGFSIDSKARRQSLGSGRRHARLRPENWKCGIYFASYLRLLTCMCRLIRSMSGGGPVTKPNLIPLLSTLEKLSKRKTRPSVSKERKLEGRLGRYCKKK